MCTKSSMCQNQLNHASIHHEIIKDGHIHCTKKDHHEAKICYICALSDQSKVITLGVNWNIVPLEE